MLMYSYLNGTAALPLVKERACVGTLGQSRRVSSTRIAYHRPILLQYNPSRRPDERMPGLFRQADVPKIHSEQASIADRDVHTSSPTPLKYFASTAAFSMACPPTTLPVNATKSTISCCTACVVSAGERCKTWITSDGTPARVSASANRSAVRGVCGEGLRSTVFPATRAGSTELTDTRYG